MNARKHWESESRNRNLSAAVLHVKPSRRNSNLYDSRENHHKVEILNYSVSLQYSKRNRDFITINFQKFSFFQGVFHLLERYIGFEPWDLFPLTIKCCRKYLQNYKGTIFSVGWTEKYRFEIVNAVTDEPKGTIFSVISLIISTDQRYWTERSPFSSWWAGHLRGKLKRPLTSSRVNHWEIALYSSFFKLVKDIREKSMENNGDEIAVLFPEGHEAIQITY